MTHTHQHHTKHAKHHPHAALSKPIQFAPLARLGELALGSRLPTSATSLVPPTNSLILYLVAVATSPLPQFVVQRCVTPLLSRACALPNCTSLREQLYGRCRSSPIDEHPLYASDDWSRSSAPAISSECTSCVDNPVRARLRRHWRAWRGVGGGIQFRRDPI
jgi:hypothetical protein